MLSSAAQIRVCVCVCPVAAFAVHISYTKQDTAHTNAAHLGPQLAPSHRYAAPTVKACFGTAAFSADGG